MVRNREFDIEEVLEKCMLLFLEKGYGATSLKDLENATGLKPGSLYNSFKSKQELFQKTVRHYNRIIVKQRINTYLQPHEGLAGFKMFFLSVLDTPEDKAFGCLLTNTAIEFGQSNRNFTRDVTAGLSLLEKSFRDHIENAQLKGAMIQKEPASELSLQMLLFYQGLLVLLRAGRDKTDLKRQVIEFLKKFSQEKSDG